MRAGRLDRQITIRTPALTQDTHGGSVETFSDLATVWAERVPNGGRRFLAAAQIQPGLQVIYRIRYRSDFDETARIVDDGNEYGILAIHEIGRRDGLEILGRRP